MLVSVPCIEASINPAFHVDVDWLPTEFTSGSTCSVVESDNVNNTVTLRVSYNVDNADAFEGADKQGIVIHVPGIGDVKRFGCLRADVGADEFTSSYSEYDWSYSYDARTDTYAFFNNKEYEANSIISGYFDVVFTLNATECKDGYTKTLVCHVDDGKYSYDLDPLYFEHHTTPHEYKSSIDLRKVQNPYGLDEELEGSFSDYAFHRFVIDFSEIKHSRGLSQKDYYIDFAYGSDVTDVSVCHSSMGLTHMGGSVYKINRDITDRDSYEGINEVIVAYKRGSYPEGTACATYLSGAFYEGDENGNTDVQVLTLSEVNVPPTTDYMFPEIPGDIYNVEHYFDRTEMKGALLTQNYVLPVYTSVSFNTPMGESLYYDVIHDLFNVVQMRGDYRFLDVNDYNITELVLPRMYAVKNSNGVSLRNFTLPIEIYAATDSNVVQFDEEHRVFTGELNNTYQSVKFPENTVAYAIRVKNLTFDVEGMLFEAKVNFHLDEERHDLTTMTDLWEGQIVTNAGLRFDSEIGGQFSHPDASWYETESVGLDFAGYDYASYGEYLDRERSTIEFYTSLPSHIQAIGSMESPKFLADNYYVKYSFGAKFEYIDESPNKFTILTVLPEHTTIAQYNVSEDLYGLMSLQGTGCFEDINLKDYCTINVLENYRDSGLTAVKLDFDLQGQVTKSTGKVEAYLDINVPRIYSSYMRSGIKSKVIAYPNEPVYLYENNLIADDGGWFDVPGIMADVNEDGSMSDLVAYTTASTSIKVVDAAELEFIKYVQTSTTGGYINGSALVEEGTDYQYAFRVRTSLQDLNDMIIYDDIEQLNAEAPLGTIVSVELPEGYENAKVLFYKDDVEVEPENATRIVIDFTGITIPKNSELIFVVNMKAPEDDTLLDTTFGNRYYLECLFVNTDTGDVTAYPSNPSNPVYVTLSPKLVNVVVKKVDGVSGEGIQGTRLALYDKDTEELIKTKSTNSKGYAVFTKVPTNGNFYVSEVEASEGYILSDEKIDVIFTDSDRVDITFENERKKGTITVVKRNAIDTNLEVVGAEYGLYTDDDTLLSKAVTNEEGVATFYDVDWGTFYVKEITAPTGYVLDDAKHSVTVNCENVEDIVSIETFNEQSPDVVFTLNKMDTPLPGDDVSVSSNLIPNCIFQLNRITDTGDSVYIGRYVTNSNGQIVIEDELSYGTYEIREVRAATGYKVNNDTFTFTLSPECRTATLDVPNERRNPELNLYKIDSNGEPITADVTVELFDANHESLGEYTFSNYQKITIDYWGKVFVKEVKAPVGYVIDNTEYEIEVGSHNLNAELRLTNERVKGTVKLVKFDTDQQNKLADAHYNLYNESGTLIVEDVVTQEDGTAIVDGLDWGNYYFKETQAPVGYTVSNDLIRFSVNQLNVYSIQEVIAIDEVDTRSIAVTKRIPSDYNFENGQASFIFELTGQDVNGDLHTYYETVTISSDMVQQGYTEARTSFSGLLAGNYTLSEIDVSRFDLNSVTVENGEVIDNCCVFNMVDNITASALFSNDLFERQFNSHTSVVTNIVSNVKMTGISVIYNGDYIVPAGSNIDTSLVEVYAVYDDGTLVKLDNSSVEFDTQQFSYMNGTYSVGVSYTSNGSVYKSYFDYCVENGQPEVVAMTARYIPGYVPLEQGSEISTKDFEFDVTYADGTTERLRKGLTSTDVYTGSNSSYDCTKFTINALGNWGESANLQISYNSNAISYGSNYYGRVSRIDSEGNETEVLYFNVRKCATSPVSFTYDPNFTYVYSVINKGNTITHLDFTLQEIEPVYPISSEPAVAPSVEGDFDVTFTYGNVKATCVAEADTNRLGSVYTDDADFYIYKDGTCYVTPHSVNTSTGPCNNSSLSSYKSSITKIEFNSHLEKIPKGAFFNCKGIVDLNIPENIKYIDNAAFEQVPLGSLTFSEGLIEIGERAFYYFNDTANGSDDMFINLPSTLEHIGKEAFTSKSPHNRKVHFVLNEGLKYIGDQAFYCIRDHITTDLVIPSTVVYVGYRAFSHANYKTCVMLPNDDLDLERTFAGVDWCYMTSVTIPEGVTAIGPSAFNGNSVKEITLPSTLKSIGDGAFYSSGITELVLPENLEVIDGTIDSVSRVFVHSDNKHFIGNSEGTFVQTTDGIIKFLYMAYAGDVVIPDCEVLDLGLISVSRLGKVVIPDTCKTLISDIGSSYIDELVIGSNVTTIEKPTLAFFMCSVGTLHIPNSLTDYTWIQEFTAIDDIVISETHPTLGYDTEFKCLYVKETMVCIAALGNTVPSYITTIDSICSNPKSFTIPDTVTSINSHLFNNVTTEVYVGSGVSRIYPLWRSSSSGTEYHVYIAPEVSYISSSAFNNKTVVHYSGTATGSPWGAKAVYNDY